MRINISLKTLLLLLAAGVILGLLISITGRLIDVLASTRVDYIKSLIPTLGSLIGSVIGLMGAVLVATFQIRKTFELERGKGVASNSAILRLIKTELQTNLRIVQQFRDDYLNGDNSFVVHIGTDNWDKCLLNIGLEISDETLSHTTSSYNKLKLLKSDTRLNETTYDMLVSDISNTIQKVQTDLNNLVSST